jgi:hypothetical protein
MFQKEAGEELVKAIRQAAAAERLQSSSSSAKIMNKIKILMRNENQSNPLKIKPGHKIEL